MRTGLILLLLGLLIGHGSVIHGQVYEICDNGIDDDGDLLVDCDDSDCILVHRFSSPPGSINEGAAVDLGDVDGDGDLDAWICQINSTPDILWINDGNGHFAECQIPIGAFDSRDVQLGDLDGDGDLDAFLAVGELGSANNNPNRVYFNDGTGNFVNSGQSLGSAFSLGIELGDLDGDGDLDAWVANAEPTQDRVWFNDGDGNFSTSGNGYGAISSLAVALGDVDGDGDLEGVTSGLINGSSLEYLNLLYLNDGTGTFIPSNQNLSTTGYLGEDVELADLEGDGDPIAIYRLSANDNSVVERLFPGQKKEMVTMYFLNDGELTLTHFCALSNQPTMVAEPGKAGEIWFRFKGITNLGDRNNQHMHEHCLQFHEDPNRMDATWVLWEGNQEKEQRVFPMVRR